MSEAMERAKTVFVRAYERVRYRRREHVRSHYRSPPDRQLSFAFY